MEENLGEQYDIDNLTLEILDRLLSESFKARLHVEKACEEKDCQLRSTQVHVTELEEMVEEGLALLDENDSSGLLEVESIDEFVEEDKECENEINNDLKKECAEEELGKNKRKLLDKKIDVIEQKDKKRFEREVQ